MNKLIVIGWLGTRTVYLNVTREEAIRRYATDEMIPDLKKAAAYIEENKLLEEFEFVDEFWAYDVSAPINKKMG